MSKTYEMAKNSDLYRMIATIWASETIMNGSAGSMTESYIKPQFYDIFRTFYTNVSVSIQGTVWLNINGCCVQQPVPYSYLGVLDNRVSIINRFTQSKKVRYLPSELWSTHSLQMNGGEIFYNGENLYLQ